MKKYFSRSTLSRAAPCAPPDGDTASSVKRTDQEKLHLVEFRSRKKPANSRLMEEEQARKKRTRERDAAGGCRRNGNARSPAVKTSYRASLASPVPRIGKRSRSNEFDEDSLSERTHP